MIKLNHLLIVGCVIAAAGCNDGGMTKEQEEAMRHPKPVENWKGPSQSDMNKMASEVQAYNEKHKNDKVEFNTPGK